MLTSFKSTLARRLALASITAVLSANAGAAVTDLADAPLGATVIVPANVILDISVEWPTGDDASYLGSYSSATEYVGYWNPNFCYTYDATLNYFTPQSQASSHTCSGKWSGNFLNWALTQVIDPMRRALTGGFRSVDDASTTVLQKGYSDNQIATGGYPDKTLSSGVSSATPFNWTSITVSNRALGKQFVFSSSAACGNTCGTNAPPNPAPSLSAGFTSTAYPGDAAAAAASTGPASALTCSAVTGSGSNKYCSTATYTQTSTTTTSAVQTTTTYQETCRTIGIKNNTGDLGTCLAWNAPTTSGTTTTKLAYVLNGAVQVCNSVDTSGTFADLESAGGRCRAYGSNYKPVGLMQQNAAETTLQKDSIRYSIFGYLLDNDIKRDGGVMRAKMKSVGPLAFDPGKVPTANTAAEWDASTGVFTPNPDGATLTGGVNNSGVINYLNQFGYLNGYKDYDPVSELYYAATRYYRNLGNVPSYSQTATSASSGSALSAGQAATMIDGFPVVSTWDDPIKYSCSKNYIIGIGDLHTHADSNLPGTTYSSGNEPTKPSAVTSDTGVDVKKATNQVATLENLVSGSAGGGSNDYQLNTGIGNSAIDSQGSPTGGWCCNLHSFFIAGLAYDVHTRDIRPDITSKQAPVNVSTFWVDVFENADYHEKNQFWLATKYGGFDTNPTFVTDPADPKSWPTGGLEYNISTSTALPQSWWNTGSYVDNHNNLSPDQYYQADNAAKMQAGFKSAFDKIHANAPKGNSSSLALASKNVTTTGNSNYASTFAKDYSGDVIGSQVAFSLAGGATSTVVWDAHNWLPNTAPAVSGVTKMTADSRIIATSSSVGSAKGVPFRMPGSGAGITSSEAATLGSSTAIQTNILNYVRGDQTNESASGLRPRTYTLGDITNSKPVVVDKPSQPYIDSSNNPGYSSFVSSKSSRKKMVYVGANDGMLHGFDGVTDGSSSTGGKEMFAYVPSFLFNTNSDSAGFKVGLASLAVNPLQHHFLVDSTPFVTDVDFNRTGAGNVSSATAADWRTILVGGLGKGGKGYFALDVTNPASNTTEANLAANVLWEVSPSTMGYSYGIPAVAKTQKYGWTVFLTSGYGNSDGHGYIYLVNPKNGSILETIQVGDSSVGSLSSPVGLAGISPSIPQNDDFTADALYVGDLLGNLWRVDLNTTSSLSAVKIATLTDTNGKAQPVTTRPVITVDPTNADRYVFVGTGRVLADTDIVSTDQQSFYAIKDGTLSAIDSALSVTRSNLADNSGTTDLTGVSLSGKKGFFMDLAVSTAGAGLLSSAERVNIDPTAAQSVGAVAFAANLIGQDVCTTGTARVFALNFNSGTGAIGQTLLLGSSGSLVSSVQNVNGATNTPPAGTITDLTFVSNNGVLQLYSGDSTNLLNNYQLTNPGGPGGRRLNWREVPSTN